MSPWILTSVSKSNVSNHVMSATGYITKSQRQALQLAWVDRVLRPLIAKARVRFLVKSEFFQVNLIFNRLGCSFYCEDRFYFHNVVRNLIIYKKKLLNSDWLRKECSASVTRVQTCNTTAKLVTRMQITNGFWLAENTEETTKNQSD